MALTLTSGGESRLDGAPDQLLPPFADGVEALAQAILADDTENIYGGDINLARQIARQQLGEMSARSRAGQNAAAQSGAERNRTRAARQGVVPESLPMDEYGSVSGRTVRDANLPLDEQEARQEQYDGLAADEIKAMREGRFHGAEAQARQYEQDYGLPTNPSRTGKTDLDYLREIQQQQGFIRTGSGEMIPIGPAITPEAIASRRDLNEWANETPGTERQARYAPADYAEWQEARAQEIQANARKEMEKYGTGSSDPQVRADTGLAPLSPEQVEARARRDRAAERARAYRQATAERRRERLEADPKLAAEAQAREEDKKARRDNLRNQRLLLAPGGRGVANAINMLPPGWREIAILDRLTEGRVGGPTPLGVDAAGAQNAMRFLNYEAIAGMDPMRRALAQQQADIALRGQAPEIAGQNDIAAGNWETPEARSVLDGVAERHDTTYFGMSYEDEARLAQTLQAPPYNMSQPDAEAKAYELAQKRRRVSGSRPEDRGRPQAQGPAPSAPAAPPRPYAGDQVPSQPPVTGRAAPPPGAHQWHGGRGQQLPSGAGRGNGR